MIEVPIIDDTAEQAWEAEWRQYHLRLAMGRIRTEFNAKDVSAFEMYAAEGRDTSAVASTLGVSVDQVYQAKSRIMRRLKAIIAEQTADEG
jgi:RNA polymerase sigma-70 factor (ECF subfamily)